MDIKKLLRNQNFLARLDEFLTKEYGIFDSLVFSYIKDVIDIDLEFSDISDNIKIVKFISDIDKNCKIDRLKRLADDFYLWDKNLDNI